MTFPYQTKSFPQLVEEGETEAVKQLLKEKADPNATNPEGTPVLQLAVHHEHVEILYALLIYGADTNLPDAKGFTALYRSVAYRHNKAAKDMTNALLSYNANPNLEIPSAL